MAGSMASPLRGAGRDGDLNDPFVTTPSNGSHVRYSNFDAQLLSLGPGASADQAKRALEAHLAETDRRMEEAGKLGTALVQQRKQLEERLREVMEVQAQGELAPDLRKKLIDIEKDYNEVARESARAFLPKPRIPSNELNSGSPFAPDGKSGGRRSVSPSKFESQATGSPTKLSVPNRRTRNQPSNRIHDIEFAAEISTSLISQVRNLQALLSEREEELRDIKVEKSRIEAEAEAFQQRVKTLDESENRYKDENWNLETQLHELIGAQKEASDREKKLTQQLNTLQVDKNSTQRELDEIKVTHAKLVEDHAASVKQHDIELGTVKRNIIMAETERTAMQRKIDDLTSQNQELAKAFSTQRGRMLERESAQGMLDGELDNDDDNITPEHSPPPSPVKGTPRHSMLESETLKTSLTHAQRTIQSLRTNVHREKTEKMELRRMLQEVRDDLERVRADPTAATTTRRSRKMESREFKKPLKPAHLGEHRVSRNEFYLEDDNWEDAGDPLSPSRIPTLRHARSSEKPTVLESTESDHFDTAHETSDADFATANERATETEDFQTVAEELSDDATETESLSRGVGRLKRPPSLPLNQHRNQDQSAYNYQSTASTSGDEDDYSFVGSDLKTPPANLPSRMRFRSRGALSRRSRQNSEEPSFQSSPAQFQSSPASFATSSGTPQATGQSLFAELGELDGSDNDSYTATPSRRSIRSMTPASVRLRAVSPMPPLPKAPMVSSGTMTEPVSIQGAHMSPPETTGFKEHPLSMDCAIAPFQDRSIDEAWEGSGSRPVSMSTISYSDASVQHNPDIDEELARFPSPPTSPPRLGAVPFPILPPPVSLNYSSIQTEEVQPISEPEVLPPLPPALSVSKIWAEGIEPISEPDVAPPALTVSSIWAEAVEPVSEPEVVPPPPAPLNWSAIQAEDIQPVSEPVIPPAPLSISTIFAEGIEPIKEPEIPVPEFSVSNIFSQGIEPVSEPEIPVPALTMSSIQVEHVEPLGEPEVAVVPPPALSLSAISSLNVEPIAEPEPVVDSREPVVALAAVVPKETKAVVEEPIPVKLEFSAVHTQYHVAPVEVEEPEVLVAAPEPLAFSAIQTQDVSPVAQIPAELAFSLIKGEIIEPVAELEIPQPDLSISTIVSETVEPVAAVQPTLTISIITSEHLQPVASPEPPLSLSKITAEKVEPLAPVEPTLSMSAITSENVQPISRPEPALPALSLSSIWAEQVEPIEPVERPAKRLRSIPNLGYSSIMNNANMAPASPRSPKRNGFYIPRDEERPYTPNDDVFGAAAIRGRTKEPSTPIIAEDETRQSASASPTAETPESQRPLKELPSALNAKPIRKKSVLTMNQSAQTSLTSDAIDQIMALRTSTTSPTFGHQKMDSFGTSIGTPGTVRQKRSEESVGSVIRHKIKPDSDIDYFYRPGSAASTRSMQMSQDLPPLPPNHKQVIEAARTGSSRGGSGTIGTMGPPLLPASAYKNATQRPRTPTGAARRPISPASVISNSVRGTPTPKPVREAVRGENHGHADVYSPSRLERSRQSSMSSFASEVDARFNMQAGVPMGMSDHGFGPNTDPRMIQAITQTMIGEYLWKYTRKTGRGDFSENRHRRYFWVHPYTRTLYWSDRDPSMAGRSEARIKSVPIEAVRVCTDDNPMPPGLHRKSLTIMSPGRAIKFTCTTGQRHETWFNALSYLLLRTNAEGQADTESMAEHITSEDVDEFNPQVGMHRPAVGTRAHTTPRPPASLSSYNSRTLTRNESPAYNVSLDVPTLTKSPKKNEAQQHPQRPGMGTLSRISGYWRTSTLGSLRSRSAGAVQNRAHAVYENEENQVHDSAEELRIMYEQADREAARLENVRACCDGKHDVGTLHKRGSHMSHNHHYHPGQSTTPTPDATVRSRV